MEGGASRAQARPPHAHSSQQFSAQIALPGSHPAASNRARAVPGPAEGGFQKLAYLRFAPPPSRIPKLPLAADICQEMPSDVIVVHVHVYW